MSRQPTPAETLSRLHALRAEYTRRCFRHLDCAKKQTSGTNAHRSELHLLSKYWKAIGHIRAATERTFRQLTTEHLAERFALRHSGGRSA